MREIVIEDARTSTLFMTQAILPEATLDLPPLAVTIFIFAFGAIIGSFLNVVIHRLPREESIVFPNSRCPSCAAEISFYDNIPVLSYLFLRGRCRHCHTQISARYPMVEALTGLLYVLVFLHDGLSFALSFDLIFVTALVALIFIDAEFMILPDAITYPGMIFALIARLTIPYLVSPSVFDDLEGLMNGTGAKWPLWLVSIFGACLGALAGGGSLWLMGWLWRRFRGVEAMGLGDVKMMLMVGAYLGWRLTILTIFIGVLSGSITGVLLMIRRGDRDMQMLLPFGIFLGAGSIIALLFGRLIINWYIAQFIPSA
jgi:leader peptidase (prepilin peptidase)/N-methyltransferase